MGCYAVNLETLIDNQLLISAAAACFISGALLSWLCCRPRSQPGEDPRNQRIRQLDADLRSAERTIAETEEMLDAQSAELESATETLRELRGQVVAHERDNEQLNRELNEEAKKTRELRKELQDRAADRLREQVRAKEAQTELEVVRAGSEAVMSEINRLQEERKSLTSTVRSLEASINQEDEV